MAGFSLNIFLPDGKPDGLRIVTKSHWTGIAAMVSRTDYLSVKDREIFQSTGVYVLVGPNEDDPSINEIYIGEGDVVHTRIASHLAKLDFWTDVIVFTKSDGTLNKAHVRGLEAALIGLANAANRYQVNNSTAPSPPEPDEATKADLNSFLGEMLIIFRLLGIDAFDEPGAITTPKDEILKFKLGAASGTGQRTSDGFLVFAESVASKQENKGFSAGYQSLRQTLLKTGVLQDQGDEYKLTQDFVFSSPSAAGAVLYGGQVAGPRQWKYPNGESLKEREEKAATI
jgi:hypothetical protein